MSTADSTTDPTTGRARRRRFRVQDSAPALWLATLVLLVSGYGVLRLLTGASDAPTVDSSGTVEATLSAPVNEPPEDNVYKLRPQTSSDVLGIESLSPSESMLSTGDSWDILPTAAWPTIPDDDKSAGFDTTDVDVAQQPELLR